MEFNVVSQILGFEKVKSVKLSKIDELFARIDSKDDEKFSLTVVNPFLLRDYDFEISDFYKHSLMLDESCQILTYCVMIIAKPLEDSAINFIAPFVFNVTKRRCAQIILDNNKYSQYGIMEKISDYIKK
jgi:flagellar assembly factor FliW